MGGTWAFGKLFLYVYHSKISNRSLADQFVYLSVSLFVRRQPESNILDPRLIEEFERTRVKIKCDPESKSTSVAGRSLRKTPARASANSTQSQEERRIKNECQANDECEDLNKRVHLSTDLTGSSPCDSNSTPIPRLSSPSSLTRESSDNFKILIKDCSPNHQDNSNKEKLMNFYKNEYQNGYPNEMKSEYNGGTKEHKNEIRQKNETKAYGLGYQSEDSDEQEEDKSEEDSYSSYSPSSSPDSQNDDHLNQNQRLNQIDLQKATKNAVNNSSIQSVRVREMNSGTSSSVSNAIPSKPVTVVNSSRKVAAGNQSTIKSSNPKATISSLKFEQCTDHVRNNLTNLNHLSPTTLKISLKSGKSFAANGLDDSSRPASFGRTNELARSHRASSYNQNDEKMDTSTNEPSTGSSFSESDEESLDNSLESPPSYEDGQTVGGRKIWRPDFFRDRMEFANQVVITQIRDPQSKSIITFKESRKSFSEFN